MNMNKIGLITIHDTQNYGSLLQCYSLYAAVRTLGYDVELIDYKCLAIAERETTYAINECKSIKDYIKHILLHSDMKKKKNSIWNFIRKNIKLSKPYDMTNISEANGEYDTFLVGSDIVWGMNVTGRDFSYLLEFAEDTKRKVAFSSSIGTLWDSVDSDKIKSLLLRFDFISVRGKIAAEWIKDLIKEEVQVTCDPTMLWDKDFWKQYVIPNYAPKGKYVLVYMTTKDKKNIADSILYGKKHSMPVYYINFDIPVRGVKNIRPISVEQWISLFANAQTVFSASYHGILFALYFGKDVFYYNRGNKSRMDSLGRELGIEHREGTDENINKDQNIEWVYVDNVIREKREQSWNLLIKKMNEYANTLK